MKTPSQRPQDTTTEANLAPVWHTGANRQVLWTHFRDKRGDLRYVFAYTCGAGFEAYVFDGAFQRLRKETYATRQAMRDAIARRAQG